MKYELLIHFINEENEKTRNGKEQGLVTCIYILIALCYIINFYNLFYSTSN